jgi:probable rRNA maturation factor
MSKIRIDIADEQENHPVDDVLCERLTKAAIKIANDYGFEFGEISIAILDDAAIRKINAEFLQHDWATDAITFPFEASDGRLEGEIVVSRETADRVAVDLPWTDDDELLLYVIHGMLHLVGFDDQDDESRREMKEEEKNYLLHFGVPGAENHE